MPTEELPFANTLEGASNEDIEGLAEHLSAKFPDESDALTVTLHQPEEMKEKMLPRLVRRLIEQLLRRRKKSYELRRPDSPMSEDAIMEKARRQVGMVSPAAIAAIAAKDGVPFEVAEMRLVMKIAKGLRAGME